YGVTPRWTVAPYLLTKREHGGKFEVEGWRLEQRYRFGERAERQLLPAAYLEVNKEKGEPYELEAKAITSLLFKDAIWSFNLIAERKLEGGEDVEWGYSTGVARLTRVHGFRLGAELFGSFTDRQHFAGPVIGYSF